MVNPASASALSPAGVLLPWLRRAVRSPRRQAALLLAGDVVIAAASFCLAIWLWTLTYRAPFWLGGLLRLPWWLYLPIPVWVGLILPLSGRSRAATLSDTARGLLVAAGAMGVIYLAAYFLLPRDLLPRLAFVYFLAAATALTLAWRYLAHRALASTVLQRRVIVVGAGWAGRTLLQALQGQQRLLWRAVGLVDDAPDKHGQSVLGVPVLGGSDGLLAAARRLEATEVVLAISGSLRAETLQALLDCQAAGLAVTRMPALFEQITGCVPIDHIDADWVNSAFLAPAEQRLWYHGLKRCLDVAGAALGLLAMLPVWPVIAAALWLESGWPVVIRQQRLGQDGRPFILHKFRSMVHDAEADGEARWASRDDERITPLGRWLRRTRLDESAQFINVLRGEMSLVGPRPERPEFIQRLEHEIPFFRARLLAKPGLTGWAQVNYGYAGTVADHALKLQWDLFYIKHQSLWLDALIVLRTIPVILRMRGT